MPVKGNGSTNHHCVSKGPFKNIIIARNSETGFLVRDMEKFPSRSFSPKKTSRIPNIS
jgi:hypothetical protein